MLDHATSVDPMVPRPFVVRRTRRETADTATVTLEPLDGPGIAFAPGQFTMIGRPGYGEVPISISGDPTDTTTLVHTVRAVGDASAALARSRRGDVVLVRGPYGTGWDVDAGAGGDVVIVAGGIGLAPLRPAVLEVLSHRDRFRRVHLVYGSRTPDQLLYPHELERWRGRFDVDVAVTVDAAGPDWRGSVGVVTTVLPRDGIDPATTLALVCGPEIMMRLTADALCDLGLAADRVRISMERNMKCGIGLCGHCQLREHFVCLDGPVYSYDRMRDLLRAREV
jgi:NAD(P)H-flavin reductase